MASVSWTKEQKQAIEEKGSNLLVAAAAGSGKTAVLVERIIHKIIDEKMDIDKMLVVTFTNAAASEMRERILDAIYKKIEENPNDNHLQRQIVLLNKANICTIHSFCLEVIRNYFYEIDIPANFKIGDSSEMELLKQETLEDLFEEKYINKDKGFLELIDIYASYRGDENLKELVLRIDNQIQSNPFPKEWLIEKVEMFNLSNIENDFSKTIWGELILEEILEEITENKLKLEKVYQKLKLYPELEKFSTVIFKDKEQLEDIEKILESNDENKWEKCYLKIQDLKFEKWPIDKKVTIELKNEAKDIRDKVKKSVNSLLEKTMIYSSKESNEIIYQMYPVLNNLKDLVIEFEDKFSNRKKEKNVIDFHDIEHFALDILIKRNEKNEIIPSKIAEEMQLKFEEVAIDEYQDSNLVQEYILNSVSNKNNIFMVGDIKQSIYRFREARPDLFLEKYKKYEIVKDINDVTANAYFDCNSQSLNSQQLKETDATKGNVPNVTGRKIKLFKNFRSRKQVLDITNWVFEAIMSEKLGDVEYTEEEFLNLGASYEESENLVPELHVLDFAKEEENIWKDEEEKTEDEKNIEMIEKNVEEAKMVVNRIEELFSQNFMVYDKKKGKRKIEYRDIAILLRSTANVAPIYEKELLNRKIPVFCDTSSEYLEATEIQTILAILKIIDNPMQDIPLVNVMRSPIGNFTDNELVEIRLADNKGYFYEAMLKKRIASEDKLRNKIDSFLEFLENCRQLEKEIPLNELIWKIYTDTNYYNYVGLLPNGALRQANLKMLFERAKQYESASFKGLYNFIHFIDRLRLSSKDLSSAKIVGENDNVVRIMSIHKSKGLEFPVVFVCNVGKQFNKQDLNDTILLHQDLGFGPKCIDMQNHIEYSTLAKEAIRLKLEKEMISEEMRVLYVALTRAREKLIITANNKDWNKLYKEKQEMISLYGQTEKDKIQERLLKKYISYLDWFALLLAKDIKQNKLELKVHKLDEYVNKEEQIQEKEILKKEVEKDEIEKIRKELEWEYPYIISSQIPTKTSVSKLKEQKQEEMNEIYLDELLESKKQYNMEVPNFMIEKQENISSSKRGTLIHLCMQKLDPKKEYKREDFESLIKEFVDKEIILKEESEAISISVLENYIKSDLWNELKNAKEIHKEEPFYLQLSANRVNKDYPKEDNILVQGIIDLYYINEKDELILLDYKTDYAQKGDEQKLIDKYKEQLNLYKEALEEALNRKVDKVFIYSTWIGRIEIKE